MKKTINIRFMVLLCITIVTGIWRFVNEGAGHTPLINFTPIGALAIFGGAYFNSQIKSYVFPLLILFISDVLLMQFNYAQHQHGLLYKGWYWIYGAFALMVFIGKWLNKKVSVKSVFLSAVLSALVHLLIVDFGVWLGGGKDMSTGLPYTRDLEGLLRCYIAAVPYMKNMLIANVLYCSILFGVFELAQRRFPVLREPSLSKSL